MKTKLDRIAEIAKKEPKEKFTSLAHLINEEMLIQCHNEISGNKATGIDKVTKAKYGEELKSNVKALVTKLKSKSYRPQPAKRVNIPKPGTNKTRPLGVLAYEDKLLQRGIAKILNSIYEQDFLDFSYGFRPNRNCHGALKHLNIILEHRKTNYVVDADIEGFFDNVGHEWIMEFIAHRISDPSLKQLIKRTLKAGYMEHEIMHKTEEGTTQGGLISPILANLYLHYALDVWFEKAVKPKCKGQAYMVRYADDFVCCFQYKNDANKFYGALQKRLNKFNLSVSTEKTKIITFGRFAEEKCGREGRKKPETFDFLGFTHYCSKSQRGKFRVKRRTSRKKYKTALLNMKEWIRNNRTTPTPKLMKELNAKLRGHYQFYGITDNSRISNFNNDTKLLLFKWLNRRSQKSSFDWDKFNLFLTKHEVLKPKVYVNIYDTEDIIGNVT
ncbi:group II intron reverse transcriptase/maturase [Natranaerofaba carboxydovora]|uniref:group II intron reverse transcriptase/maturase n=1 Tax=Natranaerofaba carboxydovora TaxID=2742683 RepID=UPI001F13ECB9|nr:group II intron reverse transcriptase/maturase [Natranaerofaba carboxydovora]UMZ73039.1 Group II intron-encoded protein LtrA [Natranaerofaba carboxydovora]UMZ73729.1 Group II intron-encoded protein LtrA [Natranaerofaba carboxydovora]